MKDPDSIFLSCFRYLVSFAIASFIMSRLLHTVHFNVALNVVEM